MRQQGKSQVIEPRNIVGFKTVGAGGSAPNTNDVTTYQDKYVIADYVTLSNYDLNGTETIDGSSPGEGDTILVANQSTASENGLYEYSTSGDWTRITGLKPSYLILVKSGSTKADTLWIVKSDSFEEGTDSITIEEHSLNRNDGSINGLSSITLATGDVLLGEDSSDSYSKGKFTIDDVETYLETQFDSSYLLRSSGDFDSFTGLGSLDGLDVILVEDASDSFNKKKTTVADITALSSSHWDEEFRLSSDDSITGTTTETTFSGSSVTLSSGKYEIEVTIIGYADSGSPQAYPEFGLPFTGTLSGNLDNILKFSDSSNYTLGSLAFDQITELTENYYQYKGIFEVTGSGDLTMTFRATVVSAATVYAVAGTGYKLRSI